MIQVRGFAVVFGALVVALLSGSSYCLADEIGAKIEQLNNSAPQLTAAQIVEGSNSAEFTDAPWVQGQLDTRLVKLQVMLDRNHSSPGVIDGLVGENLSKAISAFQMMSGLPANGVLSQQVWSSLENASEEPVLVKYVETPEDVAGPFVASIPTDFNEMSKLEF